MNRLSSILLSVLVFLFALLFLTTPCAAQNTDDGQNPYVISRDAVTYGMTYAEWDAAWQQWAYSIPVANHPLFDNGDCSVGQTGPVWFLGGKFCPNGGTCNTANVVTRIPAAWSRSGQSQEPMGTDPAGQVQPRSPVLGSCPAGWNARKCPY